MQITAFSNHRPARVCAVMEAKMGYARRKKKRADITAPAIATVSRESSPERRLSPRPLWREGVIHRRLIPISKNEAYM